MSLDDLENPKAQIQVQANEFDSQLQEIRHQLNVDRDARARGDNATYELASTDLAKVAELVAETARLLDRLTDRVTHIEDRLEAQS